MIGVIISIKEDTAELKELVKTLGHEIKGEFVQIRGRATPYYVGKGKIEEIKEYVKNNNIEIAFVNDPLRPSQWYNMEKILQIPVYDRLRIILEIFAKRASRKEAQLQVKLAQLEYEKPFVRELFRRIKEGERAGFLGGGEYVVADYYEMIKRQTRKIRKELERIREERELKRRKRKEKGFYLVSIAGYTNAGKSSLLKYLTGEKVVIEERVFSTLSTKTCRMFTGKSVPILLTDTVGFIKDLPHWLVDAFHSTLEEIYLADVVILLIDITDDVEEMKIKASTSLKEIKALKKEPNIIIALNKIDLIEEKEIERKRRIIEDLLGYTCIPISAKTGKNVEKLIEEIHKVLPSPARFRVKLPKKISPDFLRWIEKSASVRYIEMDGCLNMEIVCSQRIKDKIIGKCEKVGGEVIICEN